MMKAHTPIPKVIIETRKLAADRALAARIAVMRKPPAREVGAGAIAHGKEARRA